MANIANYKTVYGDFGNRVEYVDFLWDVAANDVGTAAAYGICLAGEPLVIVYASLKVVTACAGASGTLKWGVTGDDDRFANATQGAMTSLTTGAIILPLALEGTPNVIATPYKIATDEQVLMTIATTTFSAGVLKFTLGFMKP